ncbi:hypothetical protein T10_12732 [Trichinella papuae]|uniref:Peptidase S1 domain-containing protein n=1 Tax=Trichinella papuae TaxID=268474 RepID=A0A0V1N422_9BILA|nr:hypothetical protein T10_12732 [Trichinella papuae]
MGTWEGESERECERDLLTFLSLRRASDSVSETQLPRVQFQRNIRMLFFIYFVFLNYVLQPIFSADCGVQATSNSLYKHLVVILPERHPDEKQCLGTILHLQHNDTYSDTILTSKSCLKSKELKSTVVVSLFDFSKTDTLKGIHIVRSIFPKTLGHLASKAQSTINSPVNMNRNYALLKLKNPIMYDREKHSVCLPQESEVNFPISRYCYLPTVYKNGRIGSPIKVAVHSKEIDANYSSENYQQMDLIVEAKSIFNNRKRNHQGEFIMIGMPMLCIDAEKYFDVDKYFQYGIFDQQKTILKRDLSKLIYVFTSLFNVLNHIMFVVSTKEFHHGYPGHYISPQHSWYVHSGGRECRISTNTCRFYSYTPLMSYNPTQLPESCKGYHGPSTDFSSFMHYVFTQILRYSHAVLDCASIKADILLF